MSRALEGSTFVLILVVAALIRLWLWYTLGDSPLSNHDERDYQSIAVNLEKFHEFAIRRGEPISIRPPLYPAFVATVYHFAGVQNDRAVRLIQAALGLLITCTIYPLARSLFGARVGLWAAGMTACYPSLLIYQNLLLSELVFTVLVLFMCYSLLKAYQLNTIPLLLVAGILLGLSTLARSVLWLFPPIICSFLLATWTGSLRVRLIAALTVLIGFTLPVAPWALRNTRLQKSLTVVDVMGGRNFMMGNYAYTPMTRAWTAIEASGSRSWINVLRDRYPGEFKRGLTQGQVDKLAMREAFRFVRKQPLLTLQRTIVKFFNFWGLERELIAGASEGAFGKPSRSALIMLAFVSFGSYATLLSCSIFGVTFCKPSDRRPMLLILILVAYICGLHSLAFGHSRYHIPLVPIVALFAASAIVSRREIWARRHELRFIVSGLIVALFAAGWIIEVLIMDAELLVNAIQSAN